MSTDPLVSVVIPVFNAEKYISKALNSIIRQTYNNLEILIADDCSTDKSREIINSFSDPRIRYFQNALNLGYLNTCNNLFKVSTGDFLAFQDADDWSDTTRLERTLLFLKRNPEISLCGCNFVRTSENSRKKLDASNYPLEDSDIRRFIQEKNEVPICGATVIIRKEVYNSIGGYRRFFDRIGHEHIDWILLISEKFKIANITDKLYYYRYVTTSFSRSDILSDYKKFFIKDITFFLREQRIKYHYDALQMESLKPDFNKYLSYLEQKHKTNRIIVYKRLINSRLINCDFKTAINDFIIGFRSREVNPVKITYFFIPRFVKSIIRSILK